jgi:hypothetical protein
VLSTWARLADRATTAAALEQALYEERSLLRLLAMRRTMFVVDRATAPVVHAACSLTVAARERKKLLGWIADAGFADGDAVAWLARAERAALAALADGGELTGAEVNGADPLLAQEIVLSPGKSYEGRVKIGSRLLLLLAAEGLVVRTRPRGGWTSTQFRWATLERWIGGPLPELAAEEAEAELARRWLAAFGPAAPADLQWWTGWTAKQTRRALAQPAVVEAELEDGAPGVVLADDVEPIGAVAPWVALLPGLDPTPMGWKERSFYLGAHAERVFDANGNVGPTVWADGRIVGGWAHRPDGEVAFTLLEDLGAAATAAVAAEAEALSARLGDVRLAPRARGRTAIERDLLG